MGIWSRIPGVSLTRKNNLGTALRTYATAPRNSQTLSLRDGRHIGYAEYGNSKGFPLLYSHGFPSSRLEGFAFDYLARQRNLGVVAPDRPGYGLSTFQPKRRILDYPANIQQLVDHLDISKFAVLGSSGGGPYALACAHLLQHERLSAVGILAGAGPWEAGRQYVSTGRKLTSLAATHTPTVLKAILDAAVSASRWAVSTRPATQWLDDWLERQESAEDSTMLTEERREMMLRMVFQAFAQGGAATVHEAVLLTHDWVFRFEDITYDGVRIWHGKKDAQSPIEMAAIWPNDYRTASSTNLEEKQLYGGKSWDIAEILPQLVPEQVVQGHLAAS
ncbi:hypothetical protein BDW74DRAFT_102288 [Aspergillus multicolor]|uniref:alpha/beta fold hydrolase n=1 Tax=Aspergillus multicolor TaxID=41759 RepID=UPI003CCD6B58